MFCDHEMANFNYRKRKKSSSFKFGKLFTASSIITFLIVSFLASSVDCSCSIHQFECGPAHKCIPLSHRCDGYVDCLDKSDELNCPRKNCTEFSCTNGMCIPQVWVCDGHNDCNDNSDEIDCSESCKAHEFKCYNGGCINKNRVCDGTFDCEDNSDETSLACMFHKTECTKSEFQCNNGHCVATSKTCDGHDDCGDRSDEKLRHCVQCFSDDFKCSDGTCILQEKLCNRIDDCPNGEDEVNCTFAKLCPEDEFLCHNQLECVSQKWLCDGSSDCSDGSDELNCRKLCNSTQFQCANHHCIPLSMRCNGSPECIDHSDEFDCPENQTEPTNTACFEGFRWNDITGLCDDIDECSEDSSVCSAHPCINTLGSFQCLCAAGFSLHEEKRCISNQSFHLLLLSTDNSVYQLNFSQHPVSLDPSVHQVQESFRQQSLPVMFDYNYAANYLVMANHIGQFFIRTLFTNQPVGVDLVVPSVRTTDDTNVRSLSLDWIHHLLYYINEKSNRIEVWKLTKSYTTYQLEIPLTDARAIKVNPLQGWFVWTEAGPKPKIEKCTLDGSLCEILVSEDILQPQAITVDHTTRRIFWIDSKLSSIYSVDFGGDDRRLLLKSDKCASPGDIHILDEAILWNHHSSNSIYSTNKFGLSNKINTVVDSVATETFSTLDRFLQPIQMESKPCESCGFACDQKGQCFCPIHYVLLEDGGCVHQNIITNYLNSFYNFIFRDHLSRIFLLIILIVFISFILPYTWRYAMRIFKKKGNHKWIKMNQHQSKSLSASPSAVSTTTDTSTIIGQNKSTDRLTVTYKAEESSGYSSISDQTSVRHGHVNMVDDEEPERCQFIV